MRLGHPVTHLAPCVDSVTVCTQKPQVSFVGAPVAETVVPHARSPLVSKFFARVNVVNIKNAMIAVSANNALPTEGRNQGKFSSPVSRVFMSSKSMLVPVRPVALRGAKAVITRIAAFFARPVLAPSGGKVASPAAELPGSLFDSIGVCHKCLGAMMATNFNLGLLAHDGISVEIHTPIIQKNFETACRRIEDAKRQTSLFPESAKAKASEQMALIA